MTTSPMRKIKGREGGLTQPGFRRHDATGLKDDEDEIDFSLPLSKRIMPDTWLNIPGCLVQAFHAGTANQEHLEKLIVKLDDKINALDSKM